MDGITVGDARATGDSTANALGTASQSSALSNNLSVAGGSPIAGALFTNYASSQTKASARGGTHVEANSNGKLLVGLNQHSRVGADVVSSANATGTDVRAAVLIQMYGVSTPNNTHVVFGTVSAATCCAADAAAQATVNLLADGAYVRSQKIQRINTVPGSHDQTIDFSVVSSMGPITNPSTIVSAAVAPHF